MRERQPRPGTVMRCTKKYFTEHVEDHPDGGSVTVETGEVSPGQLGLFVSMRNLRQEKYTVLGKHIEIVMIINGRMVVDHFGALDKKYVPEELVDTFFNFWEPIK